jgi:hypothetical protein
MLNDYNFISQAHTGLAPILGVMPSIVQGPGGMPFMPYWQAGDNSPPEEPDQPYPPIVPAATGGAIVQRYVPAAQEDVPLEADSSLRALSRRRNAYEQMLIFE